MSKSNSDLAAKIIDTLAEVTSEGTVIVNDGYDKDGLAKNQRTLKAYSFNVPVLGMGFGGIGKNKSEAVDNVVKQLAGELDSGTLVLSDTWASDNLEA
jgi:hypothetical protein